MRRNKIPAPKSLEFREGTAIAQRRPEVSQFLDQALSTGVLLRAGVYAFGRRRTSAPVFIGGQVQCQQATKNTVGVGTERTTFAGGQGDTTSKGVLDRPTASDVSNVVEGGAQAGLVGIASWPSGWRSTSPTEGHALGSSRRIPALTSQMVRDLRQRGRWSRVNNPQPSVFCCMQSVIVLNRARNPGRTYGEFSSPSAAGT